MRFTPAAIVTAVMLATLSSASISAPRRASDPIDAVSLDMQREAERLQAAGQLDEAIGFYETALLADPRNANAYIGLGQIALAQGLPGKAIGFYREALAMRPGNPTALEGQGLAMVQRGAIARARANLALLQTACSSRRCAEITRLSAAITAAGERTALRTEDVTPRPTIEVIGEPTDRN